MMRHECDRCRREIEADSEVWYAVRIDAQPQVSAVVSTQGEDRDHLLEVLGELEGLEEIEGGLATDYLQLEATYDLCAECYEKYRKSPLGIEPVAVGFSRN